MNVRANGRGPSMADVDESLAVRAAWLHYAGGLTQSEVAKRLGVPSVKAHRLIARAVADGAVKVTIDGDIVECVELETRLAERFGLHIARWRRISARKVSSSAPLDRPAPGS